MNTLIKSALKTFSFVFVTSYILPLQAEPLSEPFKQYWYAGDAELTSYTLKQARYGELHEGTSVLVYVTEPFLAKEQVKADTNRPDNVSVLKLNATKKFLTGIYPYSIMTSTFSPVVNNTHAIKVSMSVQEWCGNAFTQMNNRELFDIRSFSYFENEADQDFSVEKHDLENEIWTKIRLNPQELPVGNIQMIPSFEYARLVHIPLKSYSAKTTLNNHGDISTYTIEYPMLKRTLSINFSTSFPHIIQGWQDTYKSGFDANAKVLTSLGKINKTIKSKYWGQHNNKDMILREKLGL